MLSFFPVVGMPELGLPRQQASLSPTPFVQVVGGPNLDEGTDTGTLVNLIYALCGPGTSNSVEKFERQ